MRIALQPAAGPAAVRRGARTSGGSGGFTIAEQSGAGGVGEMAGTGPLASLSALGSLLAAQEIDGPADPRRRAVKRGRRLMDRLDELQLALLTGSLSPDAIGKLRQLVADRIDLAHDPALARLMRDIDLRAAVELAKIDYALEQRADPRATLGPPAPTRAQSIVDTRP